MFLFVYNSIVPIRNKRIRYKWIRIFGFEQGVVSAHSDLDESVISGTSVKDQIVVSVHNDLNENIA